MERQTVSIMKACEMVGVSRRTIYNWIAANKVEYVCGRRVAASVSSSTRSGVSRMATEWHRPSANRSVRDRSSVQGMSMTTDSKELSAQLNNQLGVILAHAELLEAKAQDAPQRARSQVVSAALEAMAVHASCANRRLRPSQIPSNKQTICDRLSYSPDCRFACLLRSAICRRFGIKFCNQHVQKKLLVSHLRRMSRSCVLTRWISTRCSWLCKSCKLLAI